MLAFLHTARAHVTAFDALVTELDPAVDTRHSVEPALLADALAASAVTDAIRGRVAHAVAELTREGARVIVCTCSTIGGAAEAAPVPQGVRVLRVDRPMAEQAVAQGGRIVLLAALATALGPARALLHEVASAQGRSIDLLEVACASAWEHFQRGDLERYTSEVARAIEQCAGRGDLILLAQASMARAAELVSNVGVPILSSPRSGVAAALALHRAAPAH